MWFFSQKVLPLSLGFVFGPALMSFCNVGSHNRLLPIFSTTDSANMRLYFDVMVHAMVVENFFLVECTVRTDRAFELFLFYMGYLIVSFVFIFVLEHFVTLITLHFRHFMRQFDVSCQRNLIFHS